MRVRTEARRDAIVAVASAVFKELGYERTTMADIAARVGGSKATLYGYFPCKEALFLAVAKTSGDDSLRPALERLVDATTDEKNALRDFGVTYLEYLTRPDVLATHRLVIAEAARSDIGKQFFEAGPHTWRVMLAGHLSESMRTGKLREADPTTTAAHLLALLEADVMPVVLYGVKASVPRERIEKAAGQAVAVFLDAYGAPEAAATAGSEPPP